MIKTYIVNIDIRNGYEDYLYAENIKKALEDGLELVIVKEADVDVKELKN